VFGVAVLGELPRMLDVRVQWCEGYKRMQEPKGVD